LYFIYFLANEHIIAREICNSLLKNTTIKSIDLGYATKVDADIIGKLLEEDRLVSLVLRGTDIGEDGALKIIHSLKKNTSLTKLDLCREYIKNG